MYKWSPRARIAYVHDVLASAASFLVSVTLRLGENTVHQLGTDGLLLGTAVFTGVAAAVFVVQPMYKGIWRYASLPDLMTIARAVTLTILIFGTAMFLITRLDALPRSTVVINWFVLVAFLGGPRFVYRFLKDRRIMVLNEARRDLSVLPIVLVGAGDGAELFLRSLQRQADASYRPVGIVAEKKMRVGRRIHGLEVMGTLDDLDKVVTDLGRRGPRPVKLVLTRDDLPGDKVRFLLDEASRLGMTLARLPKLTDLKAGATESITVRPISVEDLLGRPQTVLDQESIAALIAGRRVLVTGAGGSIGSELVRQVAALAPATLTLLDNNEFALYQIDLEVRDHHPDLPLMPRLASVRDRRRLQAVIEEVRPEVVFHAAALKHVPLVEGNPLEGLWTNAVGTRNVADLCRAAGVATVVVISTDKAVNPTNVMGGSKRIAEVYCQSLDVLDQGRSPRTHFVTVRFGNVLGSTGSVVPLFQRQLARGGPLTVTHPDMTRYFMTIREACELVLQAGALGSVQDTYRGRIFVLDMGPPVRIVDLARQMIRLAGLRPDEDIKVAFTGLRPGEKLFEEIFHTTETPVPTEREGVLIADPRREDHARVAARLDALEVACRTGNLDGALRVLFDLVPEGRFEKSCPEVDGVQP